MFRDDEDRVGFLAVVGEACGRFGLAVHGYCLMGNHYHLLTGTPRGNLARAVGWLQVTYTVRFNRRHRRCGHLFQDRFKAQLINADAYARHLSVRPPQPGAYRNRRKAVPSGGRRFFTLPLSSHRAYAGTATTGSHRLGCRWRGWASGTSGSGRTSRLAAAYRRDIASCFGGPIASPSPSFAAAWCWAGKSCGEGEGVVRGDAGGPA